MSSNASNELEVNSTWVTEVPYIPYVMRPETYIVPLVFAVIFIIGVLGNGTLIITFLLAPQMRNVPNIYIFSLAVADLLVIVVTVPLVSTIYTVDSWPWGRTLCILSEFFKDVSIGVSVFTLTALSADRYLAIVAPLRKYRSHHRSSKHAIRLSTSIALLIWLLALICGLPALIGSDIKEIIINRNKSFLLCYPFPEAWGLLYAKCMVLFRFVIYYALPLLIIAIFYALIAQHLLCDANVPGELQGVLRQIRARRKIALSVLAFVVIFGICFLPLHIFMLWFYFWPNAQEDYNQFWHVLRIVAFCLSFVNSCANPVALYFVSGTFRKYFNRYLFCKRSSLQSKGTLSLHRNTTLTLVASRRAQTMRCCSPYSNTRISGKRERSKSVIIQPKNISVERRTCSVDTTRTACRPQEEEYSIN